jgi:leucyl/phenylalanyl-tRNA--protein transferase
LILLRGLGLTVEQVLAGYARGWFPMDEPGSRELPWYATDVRAVFELNAAARARARRAVRRSLRHGEDWPLVVDRAFTEVVERCSRPRFPGDGVWLTARMRRMYAELHAAGFAHSFEVWVQGWLAAGAVAVTLGRAAMLETMFHTLPHAGNVLLVRTLDALAEYGYELCDIQLISDHTRRLGAVEIPRDEYERRLGAALGRGALE